MGMPVYYGRLGPNGRKAGRLYEEVATELSLDGCTDKVWPGGWRATAFQGRDRLNEDGGGAGHG